MIAICDADHATGLCTAHQTKPSPYIDIIYMGASKTGKTHVWYVVNKKNGPDDTPGIIKWNGAWRKYVYYSTDAFYDAQCLGQITRFLNQANEDHKHGIITKGTAKLEGYYDERQ